MVFKGWKAGPGEGTRCTGPDTTARAQRRANGEDDQPLWGKVEEPPDRGLGVKTAGGEIASAGAPLHATHGPGSALMQAAPAASPTTLASPRP